MGPIKKRKLISRVMSFIDDKEIIVIHGSRQVGKTSLLQYIMRLIEERGSAQRDIFYFDLEDFRLLDLCNASVEDVVSYLKAKGADFGNKIYLFIDEVQYLDNPSSFLKLFHDRHKEKIKLVVSGSSSFLIKKKFKDSLVGRIQDFELFTLDFEEFLEFKNLTYDLTIPAPPEVLKDELKRCYIEFIIYGGYPAIVLEDNVEKKEMKLKQIINTYIKKDIRDMADIRNIDKFNDLVKLLASQTGNLLNVFEISNTLGMAKVTVEEYIFLLENTYILKRIKPFHRNIRSELTKMPKIFFEDTGLANILTNKTFVQKLNGNLFENSIYCQLRKNLPGEDIYFWRTAKRQEVDFLLDYVDKFKKRKLTAMEVKNTFFNKHTKNLKVFKKGYDKARLYFCCFDEKEDIKQAGIEIVRPWQLLNTLNTQ